MIIIPTKKQTRLIGEILSTNWLYDKLIDSDAFGDRMDEIDEIILLLEKMEKVNENE